MTRMSEEALWRLRGPARYLDRIERAFEAGHFVLAPIPARSSGSKRPCRCASHTAIICCRATLRFRIQLF